MWPTCVHRHGMSFWQHPAWRQICRKQAPYCMEGLLQASGQQLGTRGFWVQSPVPQHCMQPCVSLERQQQKAGPRSLSQQTAA